MFWVAQAPDASPRWGPGSAGGTYLHSCRVKVIDGDTFPSSRYQDLLSSLGFKELLDMGIALFQSCLLWVKQCHGNCTPQSSPFFGWWYGYHSQSWLVWIIPANCLTSESHSSKPCLILFDCSIVALPTKNGGSFHSYVNVDQEGSLIWWERFLSSLIWCVFDIVLGSGCPQVAGSVLEHGKTLVSLWGYPLVN